MNKYSFTVDIVSESLDRDAVRSSIESCVEASLPSESSFQSVKVGPVKALSEQGAKVSRARIKGVTVAMAGDGHNAKVAEEVAA